MFLCSFFVSRRLNPLLAQEEQISLCEIGFASQTRRLNPLLAQRGSDLLRKQGGFDMYDVAIIGAGVVGSAGSCETGNTERCGAQISGSI